MEPADLLRVSSPSLAPVHCICICICIALHLLWPSLIASRLLRHFLLPDWPQQAEKNRATCNIEKENETSCAPAGHKQAPYPPYDCTWQHGLCLASFNYSRVSGGRVRCTCSARVANLLCAAQLQPPGVDRTEEYMHVVCTVPSRAAEADATEL